MNELLDSTPILTLLFALPFLGGLLVLTVPRENRTTIRNLGILVSIITFFFSLLLLRAFDTGIAAMQLTERWEWVPELGLAWQLGVDGISLFLVLLTTLVTPLVLFNAVSQIQHRVKEFTAAVLLLEAGMLGVFCATDLLLFYIFFEAMLIPMYLLIGVWGGKRRIYAAVKFFIFTMAGSLPMLVAVIYVYVSWGTFDMAALVQAAGDSPFSAREQALLFAAFSLAFAIKVPIFPLHTWLPDAHTEAPTEGSVILAAVLLKIGGYGFVRLAMPLFPHAAFTYAPWLVGLGLVGIVYGAFLAWAQQDMKKLVAYSSVSHLGFCVLGFFALNTTSVTGGVYQMLNHGLSTGALFFLVGMLYHRRHTREIEQYGGIASVMPVFALIFVFVVMSSIGLPGLNGFVGEFLILAGAFKTDWVYAAIGVSGVVLGAIYMLSLTRRVLFGPLKHEANRSLKDLSRREVGILAPIMLLILIMGIYPNPFLERITPSVKSVVERVHANKDKLPQPGPTLAQQQEQGAEEGSETER